MRLLGRDGMPAASLGGIHRGFRPVKTTMPDITPRTFAILVLAFVLLAVLLQPTSQAEPEMTADHDPILVELFTSQGCSSCPPADRLLSRLGAAGDGVIALSYHVDYWNYIGWTDPFSDAAWSERQRRYARALSSGRVYTPQLVVDGAADCVGSNEAKVRTEIARAGREPAAGELGLTLQPGANASRLHLEITARAKNGSPDERWDVMVAVFENDLVTPVGRGENSGRTLENSHVVRSLKRAFSLPASSGSERSESFDIELQEGWERSRLGIAVFLQDPETLRVYGATVRHLAG